MKKDQLYYEYCIEFFMKKKKLIFKKIRYETVYNSF